MTDVQRTLSGDVKQRYVKPDECQVVADTNKTPAENQAQGPDCEADPDACGVQTPPDNGSCDPLCTPIVLDLDHNGLHLTGLDDPVVFDLDGNGVTEISAWTAPGTADAFLALDRNGNGWIDDGRELFGNGTLLASGVPAEHGFAALAELDSPDLGGNGDGFVDAADAGYPALRVWVDSNHNAVSEPWELATLSSAGVLAIDLDYTENRRRDPHGNLLGLNSWAWIDRRPRPQRIQVVDVVFVTAH